VKGRPLKDKSCYWSEDHRFLLARAATDVLRRYPNDLVSVHDLMADGLLASLRRRKKGRLKGCYMNLCRSMFHTAVYERTGISTHYQKEKIHERVKVSSLDAIEHVDDCFPARPENADAHLLCEDLLAKLPDEDRRLLEQLYGIGCEAVSELKLERQTGVSHHAVARRRKKLLTVLGMVA